MRQKKRRDHRKTRRKAAATKALIWQRHQTTSRATSEATYHVQHPRANNHQIETTELLQRRAFFLNLTPWQRPKEKPWDGIAHRTRRLQYPRSMAKFNSNKTSQKSRTMQIHTLSLHGKEWTSCATTSLLRVRLRLNRRDFRTFIEHSYLS